MKILFIEPIAGKKGITTFHYPPLGLLALASYIRQYGYDVSLYDGNSSTQDIEEVVREYIPDIVGISMMSLTVAEGLRIAKSIKKIFSNTKIVVGGIHPTIDPESCGQDYIDYIVRGEGEVAFLEYLRGNKLPTPQPLIENLDTLPIPAYDLIDLKKYYSPYASRFPFAVMVRSRGCIFKCTFCGNGKMYGNTFRCQSPVRTIKEIRYLVDTYKIRELSFKDTELTLDKDLGYLCSLMVVNQFNLIWSCNGRATNVNEGLLEKMYRAGCRTITYGVESGNEYILRMMKKPITKDAVRRAVKLTKEAGMQVVLNFMIGNPYDTKKTIEQTIDFAIELDPDYAYFGYTTPFPGTELRDLAKQNNWLLDDRLEAIRYDKPIMNATDMPIEELNKYLDIAYRKFYFRPKHIFREIRNFKIGKIRNYWEGLCKILKSA